ncbi:phosphatase and actin regulator 2 isoform X4 [Nerophis lumbriciformis]|uniref:phosphatase and actin regulator 2 isoform X4 n=1 Tax=Nerophis lumbriciformis TaxID=546530 RepID=UPI002ADF9DA2|nr:phosphatase and actin regulator 2-like isoform X4 [Nerophis lumbriciformis]
MGETGDSHSEMKTFSAPRPLPRLRSQSDTSGFGARILSRLRGVRSVDGLEKSSSLASCDVVVDDTHNTRQQRGKLSTLGRLFKPWKWRKKKSSDRFQDLSKVLERKISTRQTREELIKKGVLIPEQDEGVSRGTQNGHATSSVSPEQVKVEMESTVTGPAQQAATPVSNDDNTAKSSHPKKSQGGGTKATTPNPAPRSRPPKDPAPPSEGGEARTTQKAENGASSVSPKASSETPSQPEEVKSSDSSSKVPQETPPAPQEPPEDQPPCADAPVGQDTTPDTPALHCAHVNTATEDTSFTEAEGDPPEEEEPGRSAEDGCDAQEDHGESAEESCSRPADSDALKPQGGLSVNTENAEVTVIPDRPTAECQTSDSDSDGPILYRDEEEEEEDEYLNSSLAIKIRRRDTLNIKLGNRPSKTELEEKNILPRSSETERLELRQQIGSKLVRSLSQRPSTEELEQRNILKQKNEAEEHQAKQEIKRKLSRKLSVRPTVAELIARRILRFNEYVEVTDAKDYDRRADKPWTRLTPADKIQLGDFLPRSRPVLCWPTWLLHFDTTCQICSFSY